MEMDTHSRVRSHVLIPGFSWNVNFIGSIPNGLHIHHTNTHGQGSKKVKVNSMQTYLHMNIIYSLCMIFPSQILIKK